MKGTRKTAGAQSRVGSSAKRLRVALVLWSGNYGGAETWSVALSRAFSRRGIESGLVIVGHPEPLCDDGSIGGLPREALRLARGAEVVLHPRAIAKAIAKIGADIAIVPSAGYLSAAIRIGGYRGKIVAVEHGTVLQLSDLPVAQRVVRQLDTLSGLWAVDAQVAPSEFMKRELRSVAHREPVVRIYPGLDTSAYETASRRSDRTDGDVTVVGFAGRLIRGKGLDVALSAIGRLSGSNQIRLEVAGEGPDRPRLELLAGTLGIVGNVGFRGWVREMPSFWRGCDVAVVPSNEWVESFGMVAVEAMACGLPVLASRNGGLEEIVVDGETGALFEPGDSLELARLLSQYASDRELCSRQGAAALRRLHSLFDIDRCAQEFEAFLLEQVG